MGFIVAMCLLHCNNETMSRVESPPARVTQSTMPAATDNRFTTMECTIDWLSASGMAFIAETGSGHLLTMDGAPDGGGRNLAPRPMETVLAGTAACSAYDVVLVLKRGRHDVRGCRVKVTSERAPTDPKVFTQIHLHFVVTGRSLPAAAVERAIALSHEKYCSATIMLGKTAEITTSLECIEG
jgi:putative redox protein